MKTMRPSPVRHPAGGLLGQEMGPLRFVRDQLVEAFLGGFEQIAALARGHAGVVDQQIERSKRSRAKAIRPRGRREMPDRTGRSRRRSARAIFRRRRAGRDRCR